MKTATIVLLVAIFLSFLSGCIIYEENYTRTISDDLFTDDEVNPTCTTITRTNNECGLIDLEVDYNEYVCAVRGYRYDASDIVFTHYDGNFGGCSSAFTVNVYNKEYFAGDFNVQLELSDHDQNHFTTISKKQSIDANKTREFYQKYNYKCGKPHIIDVVKIVIAPKRKFCEWETKIKLDPTYVCKDVNVTEEICK